MQFCYLKGAGRVNLEAIIWCGSRFSDTNLQYGLIWPIYINLPTYCKAAQHVE